MANPGRGVLPASLGAHPGFVWPFAEGVEKAAHVLEFAEPEPAPVRRLADGLLRMPGADAGRRGDIGARAGAVRGRRPDPAEPVSRSVRYTAPGAPAIEVTWQGFRDLGIWSREGGDFLCIEPWHGTASPTDFDGEFSDKPGLMLIPPGERRTLSMRIRLC